MPQGFEVYNEAGFLLLSDKTATLQYISKGLATTEAAVSFSSNGSLTIPVPSNLFAPLVAIQSYGAFGLFYTVDLGNGTINYVYNTDLNSGVGVAYYIFDMAKSLTPTTVGLELYNEAGERTYSSGTGIANVFAAFSSGTVSLTGGRDYAVVTPSFGGYRTQSYVGNPDVPNDPSAYYTQEGYQYAGYLSNTAQTGYVAGIRAINFLSSNQAEQAPDLDIPLQTCLVIDVTPFGAVSGAPTLNNTAPEQQPPPSSVSAEIRPDDTESYTEDSPNKTFWTRDAVALCPSDVTVTSRTWSLSDTTGGTWSLSSTSGTQTTPGVTNVPSGGTASATLNLQINFSNGQSATASPVQLFFTHSSFN